MEIAATGTTIWLHESSLISFMGNTRLRYSGLTVSFWVEYVMLCSSMYKPPPMIPLRHKLHTKVFPIILPPPISWWLVKLSISYWFPEEHPYIGDFSRFTAYVRTRDWYARTQRLPPVSHIGGRPSSHKANLIPQNKRQDTTAMVIPCLCSFLLTVPSSAFSELPVNKKCTRTLFRKESGSSTNCMVEN